MMNKFSILLFIGIIAVFGGIFSINQKNFILKTANEVPSLPPDADILRPIIPTVNESAKNAQQQAEQASQQKQQAATVGEMGPPKASVSAILKTTKGTITISLVLEDASNAINNFITKAKSGYYDGLKFHRVEDWIIQGGDPTGTGTGGNPIQTELNTKPFATGSVGLAASSEMPIGQGARISNDSQFFIVKQDADWLNSQYTNFGTVTEGMDIVNKIEIGDKILGITIE